MENTFKFSYKDTLRESTGLSVYNSGLQKCAPGYTWGPAVRDHYLIHYVVSGRGEYRAGDKTLPVGAGWLFLAVPGAVISYTADGEDPWVYYWVGFNGADARRLISLTPFADDGPVIPGREELEPLLADVYGSRGGSPADDAAMTGRLYLFLGGLMAAGASRPSPQAQGRRHFEAAAGYIEKSFASGISVGEVADFVGLSRSQLYRVFQRESGMSPMEYLNRFRVGVACGLLRDSRLPVSQAASSAGFADPLYFSKLFKKRKGVSPTEYAAGRREAK